MAAFIASSASAEPQCLPHQKLKEVHAGKYSEVPISLGVTHNGGLIEVLVSEDGQTWSIIITSPKGDSCLVAAGEGWRNVPTEYKGPEL